MRRAPPWYPPPDDTCTRDRKTLRWALAPDAFSNRPHHSRRRGRYIQYAVLRRRASRCASDCSRGADQDRSHAVQRIHHGHSKARNSVCAALGERWRRNLRPHIFVQQPLQLKHRGHWDRRGLTESLVWLVGPITDGPTDVWPVSTTQASAWAARQTELRFPRYRKPGRPRQSEPHQWLVHDAPRVSPGALTRQPSRGPWF